MPAGTGSQRVVGRVRELDALAAALGDARAGRGSVVMVTGEAGIGKTALANEIARRAADSGCLVVNARCWDGGGAPPFWPWAQIARALPEHELIAVLDDDARARVGRLAKGESARGGRARLERERFLLFDAVARGLRAAGAEQPVVVVLDDMQWADAGSLRLLQFVARDVVTAPVLVVATVRTPIVDDLPTDAVVLVLEGLDEDAVRGMLAAALPGGTDLSDAVVHDVHRDTAGNPFYVALVAEDLPRGASARTASDRVVLRVARMGEPAPAVLGVAAVVGEEFEPEIVAAAAALDESTVRETLAVAEREGLLRTTGGATYAFRHALVREALYGQLSPGARAQAHLAVGHALGTSDAYAARAAYHLAEALPLGDANRALETAERAAERSARQLAYEDAAVHLERALRALDHLPDVRPERRAERLLALGDARARARDRDGARAVLQDAAGIARALENPALLARVALAYPPDIEGIEVAPLEDPTQVRLREEALAGLPSAESALHARLAAATALSLYWAVGSGDRARDWESTSRRRSDLTAGALESARRLQDDEVLAAALAARLFACWEPDRMRERDALVDELVAVGTAVDDVDRILQARTFRVLSLLERGAVDDADREIAVFERTARIGRNPVHEWTVLRWRATRALMDNRLDTAEELGTRALDVGVQALEPAAAFQFYAVLLGNIRFLQSRVGELFDAARANARDNPAVPAYRCGLAFIAAQTGDYDTARAELGVLVADDLRAVPRDLNWLSSTVLLGAVAAELGDAAAVGTIERALQPYADLLAFVGSGYAYYGPVGRVLGLLAAARGDNVEARFYLENARGRCRPDDPFVSLIDRELAALGGARPSARPPAGVASLRCDGETWAITFPGSQPARLRDSKGVRYLALLLARPGVEVHVLDLVDGADTGAGDEVADTAARRAYRERVRELQDDLDDAERDGDSERAARLTAERDVVVDELARALGLGGRARVATSAAERARVNVTKLLRQTVQRVAAVDPVAGGHLDAALRTGMFCAYVPDPAVGVRWEVDPKH